MSTATRAQHEKSLTSEASLSSKTAMVVRRHAYPAASPTTPTPTMTLALALAAPIAIGGDERGRDGGAVQLEVLHMRACDRDRLGVEPPTPLPLPLPQPIDQRPALRPGSVAGLAPRAADEAKARAGNEKTPAPASTDAPTGTEPRGGPQAQAQARARARAQDRLGTGPRCDSDVDADAKPGDRDGDGGGDGQGVLAVGAGPRTRTRARLTVIESDGGVRLAGGPPGLSLMGDVDIDSDPDCVVTTLPPPYHHYDS